ncbi:MAG: hypothetical protein ABUL60_24820 [Myxococcales bacterium]
MPLAAVGIICLGLVPTLGGPDRPLHWAMTAGMVGFGGLLWARRRLHRSEGALQRVPQHLALRAGRALLTITGIVAALVGVIVALRWHSGGAISALSVGLPVIGLAWVALLGFQALNYREQATEAPTAGERPSRRPPNWDQVSKPQSTSARPGPPDRHVSA